MAAHSKLQLIRALLKNALFKNSSSVPRLSSVKKYPLQDVNFEGVSPKYLKTETLYLEDGFQNSDLDYDSITQNYSTPDNSDTEPQTKKRIVPTQPLLETKDVALSPLQKIIPKTEDIADDINTLDNHDLPNADDKAAVKDIVVDMEKVMEERKQRLNILRSFRFTKTKNVIVPKSLNENTGHFYVCRCSEPEKNNEIIPVYRKSDLQNLVSDTDTCSDTGRSCFTVDHKLYCYTCGNGYATKRKLLEHFKTHENKCSLCEKTFRSPEKYKTHLKKHLLKIFVCHHCEAEFSHKDMLLDHFDAHIEDDIYENVFRLEQDYKIENRPNQLYYLDCMLPLRYCF